jgi:hypothetical protein
MSIINTNKGEDGMKKAVGIAILFCASLLAVSGQEGSKAPAKTPAKLETQFAALKVISPTEKQSTSKMISRLWVFNENGVTGAAAVTILDEYKVEYYILVLKEKDQEVIRSVDVLDDAALLDKKMMKELVASLSVLDGMKIDTMTDAISGATVYSKKIYLKAKLIAGQLVKEIEALK